MEPSLKAESEQLARAWMRHEAGWLRDYLVEGVEDPRLNLQSVKSRHFLARALYGEQFSELMAAEVRFAAAMNWLQQFAAKLSDREEPAAILHALRQGGDNAEGRPLPGFLVRNFRQLENGGGGEPNYIASFLQCLEPRSEGVRLDQPALDAFQRLWQAATKSAPPCRLSVYEAACGSANDYRWLHSYGLARWLDYTGGDLCAANILNALRMFPGTRFQEHNVFSLPAADRSYDLCFFHDLLEHLSPEGMQIAIRELCRVTRRSLCANFFNLDEIPEHRIQPTEDYHWNRLSLGRTVEEFARNGFHAQATVNLGAWLKHQAGCEHTHNPFAYTIEFVRQ